MKKPLSILLSLVMVFSIIAMIPFTATATELTGDGSKDNPYLISDYAGLKAFAEKVNDGQTGANAKLTGNIVADDEAWTPIGNGSNKYTGTFDGDGHKITGLTTPASFGNYAGLFGYVETDGVVKNVGLEEGTINGAKWVGGIVGRGYGSVQNCYNTGTVKGNDYVGGIAGENEGTVKSCYNTGAVTGTVIYAYVGGIVGKNDNIIHDGTAEVNNCYNTGAVTGTNNGAYVGGIVGDNYAPGGTANVTNCYNTGAVTGTGSYAYVGGIAGDNFSCDDGTAKVSNCYNIGTVTGTGSNADVGGIVGENYKTDDGTAEVTNCYFDASVCGTGNAVGRIIDGTVSDTKDLTTAEMTGTGALTNMGFSDTSVWLVKENTDFYTFYPHLKGFEYDNSGSNSDWASRKLKANTMEISDYAGLKAFANEVNNNGRTDLNAILTADIEADDEAWTPIGNNSNKYTGTFDGDGHKITGLTIPSDYGDYAGLFGYVGEGGVIKNVGLEDGSINGKYNVGGIVGESNGTVHNCYNTATVKGERDVGGIVGYSNYGTVQNCYNTGTVTGNDNVGGIVGYNTSTIQNCYNTGTLKGTESPCIGGIVGKNLGKNSNKAAEIIDCYNTGAVTGTNNSAYVGGIVGYNFSTVSGTAEVTNCYNTGTVTGTDSYAEVGGIIGYHNGYNGGTANVTNCYNTGAVTGTGSNAEVGGIIGWFLGDGGGKANVTNCCFDRSVVTISGATDENNWKAIGKTEGDTTETNVKGLTTSQMTGTDALTNMGFSDTSVWLVKADGNDDADGKYYWFYPHLKGFNFENAAQQTGEEISPDKWPAKAEVSVNWSGSDSYPYKATEQKPVASSVTTGGSELNSGADYTVNYKVKNGDSWSGCTECINAGEYRAVITFGNGHPDIVKNFTINKASLKITAKNQEYEYNGSEQGPSDTIYANANDIAEFISTEGLKGTDTVTQIEIDGQGKNVGIYDLVPLSALINDGNGNKNYEITYVKGTLSITKKTINITVNGNSESKTYNGSTQNFNGTFTATSSDTGFDASKFTYTGSTSVSGKNAGEYTVLPVEANCVYDDSNYTVNWTMGTPIKLKVNPAKITIAADNKETNHGDDLDELTYKITGDYYGEDLGISLSTDADNKTPGTYDITVSYTPNSNYNVTVQNGKYVVGDNPHTWGEITYEWNGTDSVTASRTCIHCGEVETETVKTSAEQTKDPTCTDKGENTYTATFTNPAFETQTKTVEDVEAAGHKLTHYPYTAPTSTEDGNIEYWYCEECHKYFSDENGENEITETVIPLVPEYTFDSDNLEWTKDSGEDLEFTVNRSADDDKTFGLFLGIEIDGNAVSEENYTATKGSVNIKLSADYLSTLSAGEHTMKLIFTDGETETTFTVNGKEEPAEPDGGNTNVPTTEPEKNNSKPAGYEPIPKTGNGFNPLICLAVLAGPCLAAIYGRKKKEDE